MSLTIETFSNTKGGNSLYKALAHPITGQKFAALTERIAQAGPVAVYDPLGHVANLAAIYDLSPWTLAACFVRRIENLGHPVLGRAPEPVTELPDCDAPTLFVAAFDAGRALQQIGHLIPDGMEVIGFDSLRLPEEFLTNRTRYLDPLNFATNLAFFRDCGGTHSRILLVNYWASHGAPETRLWLRLYDGQGSILADWTSQLPSGVSSFAIDSQEIRARFGLSDFTGTLFIHVIGAAGHDVVKYVIDTYGDEPTVLSCTHDANPWPADRYAGLPAPDADERVVLWVQNSHPVPIPRGGIGINRMGTEAVAWLDEEIPPFGTHELDVADLLPDVVWPAQLEIRAGRYFVRPRYEVFHREGRSRIAHANVERTDLAPDPKLPELSNLIGKGYILPAPILPTDRWQSSLLPTPMATCQEELPIAALVIDSSGREIRRHRFGRLARANSSALELDGLLAESGKDLSESYGHVELVYDFDDGGEADGWLHGLFRYRDRASGHVAETSFGAHMFNLPITYGNEPQSYASAPPGLSTRLFLRLGQAPLETLLHLIYPASAPWHRRSETDLILYDAAGREIAEKRIHVPCGGSRLFRYSELFDTAVRESAGDGTYIMVRDTTCRLFGYHGLLNGEGAFSLDHMFGF